MNCGKIHDRSSAEDAFENADIFLSVKSMPLNPNWVGGVRAGKPLRIFKSEETNVAHTEKPLHFGLSFPRCNLTNM